MIICIALWSQRSNLVIGNGIRLDHCSLLFHVLVIWFVDLISKYGGRICTWKLVHMFVHCKFFLSNKAMVNVIYNPLFWILDFLYISLFRLSWGVTKLTWVQMSRLSVISLLFIMELAKISIMIVCLVHYTVLLLIHILRQLIMWLF